ncbi:hypothetical protein LCGC14_3019670, partial [marine sediment metagenome]
YIFLQFSKKLYSIYLFYNGGNAGI